MGGQVICGRGFRKIRKIHGTVIARERDTISSGTVGAAFYRLKRAPKAGHKILRKQGLLHKMMRVRTNFSLAFP
jgi:hypothetical protein